METSVADIIRLADRRSDKTRKAPTDAAPAQILLFTGVRYERIQPIAKRRNTGPKRPRSRPSKRAEG